MSSTNKRTADAISDDAILIEDFITPILLQKSGEVVSAQAGIHFGPHFLKQAAALKHGGTDNLHIISDFDQTLTTYMGSDGEAGDQCHDVILLRCSAPEEAARPGLAEAIAPLKEWTRMSETQRMVHCNYDDKARAEKTAWFNSSFLSVSVKFNLHEFVSEFVQRSNMRLRCGLQDTFSWLEASGVPFLLVSAGIRQVIEKLFIDAGLKLPSNGSILANDLQDTAVHITRRTKANALNEAPGHRELILKRNNVLVLGDKPSDLDVVCGLGESHQALKIGFIKGSPPPQKLKEYLKHFDVALTGDASMEFVNKFLLSMAGSHHRRNGGGKSTFWHFDNRLGEWQQASLLTC